MGILGSNNPRFTRSTDAVLAGICSSVAKRLEVDPLWVRLAWVAAVLCCGVGLVAYVTIWWVVPKEGTVIMESLPVGQAPIRRARRDRKIFGVLAGLARYWDVDPSALRLLAIVAATLSAGVAVLLYLAAAIFIPMDAEISSLAKS